MATAVATHRKGQVKAGAFRDLVAERRRRAEQGLASGKYRVEEAARGDGAWMWAVHGPKATYAVTAHREADGWHWECECPDFQRHADASGWMCKHIHMVKLAHKKGNGRTHKTDDVTGREQGVPTTKPATAPKRLSDRDFRAALDYAVEVIESGRVKRVGPNVWDVSGEAHVHGDGHTWTCSVCDGECRHTVTVQVLDIMQTHGFWAPLPATRILEARRKPEVKPGREASPVRTTVTVRGNTGETELVRVLGELVEQLQELNHHLHAIRKTLEEGLDDVAATIERSTRGGG